MTEGEGPAWGIVVAAGAGARMGGADKMLAPLLGWPLLAWTLDAFERCNAIDAVVIVAAPAALAPVEALARDRGVAKVRAVVPGGAERQDSVRAGLEAAREAAIVAVHDGARPLVTPAIIERGVELARACGAALCGVPARDTVKEVAGDPPAVVATPDRRRMWLAQTPQVFRRELLLEAHARAAPGATDDAMLVEALGHEVRVYEGAAWNIKVTQPEDLLVVEALLRARHERP